jgi:ribosomal subunit interface protein
MSTLSWNLAAKDLHGHELLRKELEEKIKKLEKHLQHYPAGSLHLQMVLERHPRKPLFVAKLTLHVPSNILRGEKSARDVIKAFDDAVKALLRELASLKADLRREAYWKRKECRKELHALKVGRGRLMS